MNLDLINSASFSEHAFEIIEALEGSGYEAWIVGGCVRDAIIGRPINDIDITTSSSWTETERVCLNAGMQVRESGVKHGTVTVLVPTNSACSNDEFEAFEVTTYRIDSPTSTDSRHPDSVEFTDSIIEDLARRDFTMNAMAWHPVRGLVDPFGGFDDIKSNIIRVVGDPKARFREDALRILRACRFCSQLGFTIDPETFKAMRAQKSLLLKISSERVTSELELLLMGDFVHDALMECVDVLAICVPELMAMKGFDQKTKYHIYDVLEHTAWAVQYSKRDPLIRWAAFCHDMGKPACAFFDDEGVQHFYGHAIESERVARGMLSRMSMRNSLKDDICALVTNHNDVLSPTNKSVKKMLARLGGRVDLMEDMFELKIADMRAHAPEYASSFEDIEGARSTLQDVLETSDAFTLKQLAVNGNDIISIGVETGPEVGRILNSLLNDVIDESVTNDREALLQRAKELALT